MIRVRKKEKESQERFFQRFSSQVQQSRLLAFVKEHMFYSRKPSKSKVRAKAIKREYYRTKRTKEQFY